MEPHYICTIQNGYDRKLLEPFKFFVYPNPYTDKFVVSFLDKADQPVMIKIYNALGQIVLNQVYKATTTGTQNVAITASDLPNGVYYVTLNIDGHVSSSKIIHASY